MAKNESLRENEREKAILVGLQLPGQTDRETGESLEELKALSSTAGADVAETIVQKRNSYDPATLLGRGKVDELKSAVGSTGADLVIFKNDLAVSQQDRLMRILGTRVIDRTALILDIFAQHAHTKEGRTQVELAQLSYLLPRIRGRGEEMSRLGGGIGTRGPGETKLEVDRRRIRKRIRKLEDDLEQMESVRSTQRKQRGRAGLPSVCLVGYTNSGKSSLLNRLTGASVLVEDQLFSTLDSTTRRLVMPHGQKVVVTDTVGFIRNLPHELVAAFHSTLEVVIEADLLVQVIDSSVGEGLEERWEAVRRVLRELEADQVKRIVALNKVDLIESGQRTLLERKYPDWAHISALTGEGVDKLQEEIARALSGRRVKIAVPADKWEVISSVYRDGAVFDREMSGDTVILEAELPDDRVDNYREYINQILPDATN